MTKLRMSHIAYPVTALGPGRRLALWVAGCSLRCRHCITPELLDPQSGQSLAVENVAKRILRLPLSLDGITLTGGEPFDQALALAELLAIVKHQRPIWNVLIFSGYPLNVLENRDQPTQHLLQYTDILIAGPYVDTLPAPHPLAASSNQEIHYLSPRGQALQAACDQLPWNQANLGLNQSKPDWLIGIVSDEVRRSIHEELALKVSEKENVGLPLV